MVHLNGLHFPSPNFSIYYFEMHTPPFSIRKFSTREKSKKTTSKNRKKTPIFWQNFEIFRFLLNLLEMTKYGRLARF